MNFQDFLNQQKDNAPAPRKDGESTSNVNSIQVLNMGAYTNIKEGDNYVSYPNQGTCYFVPISPLKGPHIKYIYDVAEFQVDNREEGAAEAKWSWFKTPCVKDFETALTPEQVNLIEQTRSVIAKAIELGYGTDWARYKNYALIFGYIIHQVNIDNVTLVDKTNRKMCILAIPSKNFAKAMSDCGNAIAALPTGEAFYNAIFSRNTNRQCYLELTFKRSSGYGYDVSLAAKMFDVFSAALLTEEEVNSDKMVHIPQELIDMCGTQIGKFCGNVDGGEVDFNEEYTKKIFVGASGEVNKTIADKKVAENLPPVPEGPAANAPTGGGWPTAPGAQQ